MSQESAVEPLVAAINMKRVAASSVTNISICMDSYFSDEFSSSYLTEAN